MALVELLPEVTKFVESGPKMTIGGKQLEAASGRVFEAIDPSTGNAFAEVPRGESDDVDDAVGAAGEADHRLADGEFAVHRSVGPDYLRRRSHHLGDGKQPLHACVVRGAGIVEELQEVHRVGFEDVHGFETPHPIVVLPQRRFVIEPRGLLRANRLLLGRVAVVQVDREDLSEEITAVFVMEAQPFEQEPVADVAKAERIAGFRPSLPPNGMLKGTPALSVVKRAVLATKPLNTAEMERALAGAGVSLSPTSRPPHAIVIPARIATANRAKRRQMPQAIAVSPPSGPPGNS